MWVCRNRSVSVPAILVRENRVDHLRFPSRRVLRVRAVCFGRPLRQQQDGHYFGRLAVPGRAELLDPGRFQNIHRDRNGRRWLHLAVSQRHCVLCAIARRLSIYYPFFCDLLARTVVARRTHTDTAPVLTSLTYNIECPVHCKCEYVHVFFL